MSFNIVLLIITNDTVDFVGGVVINQINDKLNKKILDRFQGNSSV